MTACKSCIWIVSRFLCARASLLHFLSIFWCCSCFSLFKFYKHKHKHTECHPCIDLRTHTLAHLALSNVCAKEGNQSWIASNHTHMYLDTDTQTHMQYTKAPCIFSINFQMTLRFSLIFCCSSFPSTCHGICILYGYTHSGCMYGAAMFSWCSGFGSCRCGLNVKAAHRIHSSFVS